MKKAATILFLLGMTVFVVMGCKQDAASSAEKQDEALKELDKSFEELKAGNEEVVEFRILKEALPDKFLGMERVDYSAQKSGIGEFQVATAEATYADGNRKVWIQIIDSGGLGEVLSGLAAWSQIEMDKESDEGYERTTMIDGRKAYERYDTKQMEGDISMISADRFIVSISGKGVTEEELRAAVSKIQIKG